MKELLKRWLGIIIWIFILPLIIAFILIAIIWDIIILPVNVLMKMDGCKVRFFLLTKAIRWWL